MPENPANGGFPEPLADAGVCVVAVRHEACGTSTRVRLPGAVPARAVHTVRCEHCQKAFEAGEIDELGLETELAELEAALGTPARRRRSRFSLPSRSQRKQPEQLKAPKAVKAPKVKAAKPASVPKLPSRSKVASVPKLPSRSSSKRPGFDPQSLGWRLLSVPVAAGLVIGGLFLLQGGGDDPRGSGASKARTASATAPVAAAVAATDTPANAGADNSIPPATAGDPTSSTSPASVAAASGGSSGDAKVVSGSSYTLALPPDWQQTEAPTGATFAAIAPDGSADATLWITQDPKLDFPNFVAQSLTQLQTLAGSAQIVERVPAPTEEGTIVRLAADSPEGEPTYDVTLRISGPYRYYLATSVQPDAPAEAAQGAELVAGSFTPEAKG